MLINFKYHWCIISSVVLLIFNLSCEKRQAKHHDQYNSDTTESISFYKIDDYGINKRISVHYYEPYCPNQDNGYISIGLYSMSDYTFCWEDADSITNRLDDLEAGHYTVTVFDTADNYAVISVQLNNQYKTCLGIPSSFTPNGDGINDTWRIRGLFYFQEAKLLIYTVQGKIAYLAYGLDILPWDGNYKGHPLEEGDYYYTLDLYNDGSEVIGGVVTIMR